MPTILGSVDFQAFYNALGQYYNYGAKWSTLTSGGYTAEQFCNIVNDMPNYHAVVNQNGEILLFESSGSETVSSAATAINSNAGASTITLQAPASTTINQETGKVIASEGVSGASGAKFVIKEVAPAIIAAGVGIKLGKTIDSTLYNLNPTYWNEHDMAALNPAMWSTITSDYKDNYGQEILGNAFNLLFGIDDTEQTGQAYIDQNAMAYMAMYLQSIGALTLPQYILPAEEQQELFYPNNYSGVNLIPGLAHGSYEQAPGLTWNFEFKNASVSHINTGMGIFYNGAGTQGYMYAIAFAKQPFTVVYELNGTDNTLTSTEVTRNGITYHVAMPSQGQTANGLSCNSTATILNHNLTNYNIWDIAYIMEYGEHTGAPEGIGDQPGATIVDLSQASTIADVLAALQQAYPEMFNNAIQYPVIQPDGTTIVYTYVPIPIPSAISATDTQPTGDGEYINQTQTDYDPAIMPEDIWKSIWDIINKDITPIDDVPGDGDTPAIITPTGSASALWKIYNPSQSQLDDFGAWLWSSDFVDQLLKVFSDPMQAIIGLHKIFVTPPVSGSGPIKVGYLTSDASANYVSGQYVNVDCGSVQLNEYFGNVLDYTSTQVSIYLPFSGIHKLDIDDVMRGTINVIYHVDVLTGACLIDVKVTRDSSGGVLYTFSGNCAVQYPVSSGSYVGIVTGLLGMAGGIAGTIMSGGMLAPALMGVGASIGSMHTNIQHSGNISANAGAMGCKKPYLIIERGQGKTPPAGLPIEGLPQNDVVTLSGLTGHVRVKRAKYNGIPCTSGELEKIKMLLENGVYIS